MQTKQSHLSDFAPDKSRPIRVAHAVTFTRMTIVCGRKHDIIYKTGSK